MLTKEQCENVLSENKIYLKNQMLKKERISHSVYLLNTATSLLERLIHEHFDNPPLTLDELYEFVKQDTDYHYLPVWDNKFGGQWFVLENINGNKLKFKGYDHPIEFEEGRYYRKEVQECN